MYRCGRSAYLCILKKGEEQLHRKGPRVELHGESASAVHHSDARSLQAIVFQRACISAWQQSSSPLVNGPGVAPAQTAMRGSSEPCLSCKRPGAAVVQQGRPVIFQTSRHHALHPSSGLLWMAAQSSSGAQKFVVGLPRRNQHLLSCDGVDHEFLIECCATASLCEMTFWPLF